MHAGLHADQVLDVFADLLVQLHQKCVGGALGQVNFVQVGLHQGRHGVSHQVGSKLFLQLVFIGEGELHGIGFQEVVEWVVDRHFNHQVHRDLELLGFVRKDQACLVVGKRVLLPVHEVPFRLHLERIGNHVAAAMRGRAQADDLRPQIDEAVVRVMGDVI